MSPLRIVDFGNTKNRINGWGTALVRTSRIVDDALQLFGIGLMYSMNRESITIA